jgi:type IX secretion system PorP/SprF family membrane protein
MKNIKYTIITLLLFISSRSNAQQESVISFYRQHMNLVNPAYVGVDGLTLATSSIRKQWTGVVDAPETQTVSFGTTLGKNLGFGMSVVADQTFVETQTFVGIDFSYKLKVSETADLYVGIKAGGNTYNLNAGGLQTYNIVSDPALESISNFNPNVGVGALYKKGELYVSLSIPRLLSTTRATNTDGFASVVTGSPHVYLSSGYDVAINSNSSSLVLRPSVMMRYVTGVPLSVDFTTMLQIEKNYEIGALYRTDQAYAALGSIRLSKRFVFGFAYEMSTRPTLASARNTNEIFLQFQF